MELQVIKSDGKNESTVQVDDSVFGIQPNGPIVHQAVTAELTNLRQGTHGSKTRGDVSGGGKKPWKQKGRGVARAGSSRSPVWRGGGTVFGPQPHAYNKSLTKKMKRLARRSILSAKASENAIIVLNELTVETPQTKTVYDLLKTLNLEGKKITFLPAVVDETVFFSLRNMPNVNIVSSIEASAYDLIDNDVILFDKAGITLLNEQLTVKN